MGYKTSFRQYFSLCNTPLKYLFLIGGIVFSIIIIIIVALAGLNDVSFMGLVMLFVGSIVVGHLLAVLFLMLSLLLSYRQVRSIEKFHNSLTPTIKEQLGLEIYVKIRDERLYYPELLIETTGIDVQFLIELTRNRKEVTITLVNEFEKGFDFIGRAREFNRKYKEQHLTLSGWGLRRTIKRKEWEMLSDQDIEDLLDDILRVSIEEEIKFLRRKEE